MLVESLGACWAVGVEGGGGWGEGALADYWGLERGGGLADYREA